MSQLHWNPFRDLEAVLDHYARQRPAMAARVAVEADAPIRADWQPLADILETETAFLLNIELPEVSKEAVKVSVNDGILSVSGERKGSAPEGAKALRQERATGHFGRRFSLPDNVNVSAIAAEYRDGVLTLTLPKLEKPQPTLIDVKIH